MTQPHDNGPKLRNGMQFLRYDNGDLRTGEKSCPVIN